MKLSDNAIETLEELEAILLEKDQSAHPFTLAVIEALKELRDIGVLSKKLSKNNKENK